MLIYKLYTSLLLLIAISRSTAKTKWKSPSVFDDELSSDCVHMQNMPDQAQEALSAKTAVYYRRVLKMLFKKEMFIKDPSSSSDYYVRNIAVKISDEQLNILGNPLTIEEMDVFKLDDLLSQVVVQSNVDKLDYPLKSLMLDLYRKELLDSLPKWDSPAVLISFGLLIVFLFIRKIHFSRLRFSAILICALMFACVVSYVMSYMDCIYELEVEQMMKLSGDGSKNNPCSDYHRESESRFGFINLMVFGSSENKCRERMKMTLKPSKRYCDPLDVGIKWIAQVQMSYLGEVIKTFTDLISHFTSSSGFIQGIIYTLFGWLVLVYVVLKCMQAAVKHGMSGMFGLFTRSSPAQSAQQASIDTNLEYKELKCKIEDLLYENKLIKRELSSQNVTLGQIRESSVERTFEQIEEPKVPSTLAIIGEEEAKDKTDSSS